MRSDAMLISGKYTESLRSSLWESEHPINEPCNGGLVVSPAALNSRSGGIKIPTSTVRC